MIVHVVVTVGPDHIVWHDLLYIRIFGKPGTHPQLAKALKANMFTLTVIIKI